VKRKGPADMQGAAVPRKQKEKGELLEGLLIKEFGSITKTLKDMKQDCPCRPANEKASMMVQGISSSPIGTWYSSV